MKDLPPTQIAFAIVCVLILFLVLRAIYYAFLHPLAKVPGPQLYAASQIPYAYHIYTGQWPHKLKDLHCKYGPVVRFGPTDVSFIGPEVWKKIYGHQRAGELTFEKDRRIYRAQSATPSIITADNDDHKRMRRLLAHAFSEKALREQETIMRHYIDTLIDKLTQIAGKGGPVDIVSWYNFTTFDLIGDLAFGQPFGCLESGGYHPWVAMLFDTVRHTAYTQLAKRFPMLKSVIVGRIPKKLLQSLGEHRKLSEITAMKRIQGKENSRNDFMSYILRNNNEKGMSVPEIIENANTLIVAGSETTATQLSGTTFNLLTNQEVYNKLVKEIRSSFRSEEDITLVSVNGLQYMLAVFNESFRMYPPVPVGLPRFVPTGGEFVEGYWMPENTSVSVPQLAAYYSPSNWKDPQSFIPERWLGDARFANDAREVLNPFSTGPRNCIGKNLAYSEMRMILARVLWKFDMEIMPDSREWKDQNIYLLWNKGKLNVKLTLAQHDNEAEL